MAMTVLLKFNKPLMNVTQPLSGKTWTASSFMLMAPALVVANI
jgi:hypothetical protein